jgi:uncharacterized protein (UPF0216 family)
MTLRRTGSPSDLLAEQASSVRNVEVELFFQRFNAVELSLASQEVSETDSRSLAVQISIEIEKVSFEE